MTGLIIFLCILLLFVLILMTWVRIGIVCDGSEVRAYAKILFVKIRLFPKKEKLPRAKDFSPRAMEKKRRKEEKKALEAQKKKEKKALKKAAKKQATSEKKSLSDIVGLVRTVARIAGEVAKKFSKYLRLDIRDLVIVVGTPDPAQTAVTYGAVSQAVSYLLEILSHLVRTRRTENSTIDVRADFLADKTVCRIKIESRLRVWHMISCAMSAAKVFMLSKFGRADTN